MKMFVWSNVAFLAVAHAESVKQARELLIPQIGGGDGSCPERDIALDHIAEMMPTIWMNANAEFALTVSAELREQEAYSEKAQKRLKQIAAIIEAVNAFPSRFITDAELREIHRLAKGE